MDTLINDAVSAPPSFIELGALYAAHVEHAVFEVPKE
jgi:hypothetical protein